MTSHTTSLRRRSVRFAALACVSVLALVACGDDESSADVSGDTHADMPSVQVGLIDFAFEDVPATIEAGTKVGITNTSSTELHELVAVLLPADEQRSADELVALPPEQLGALIGNAPAMVQIAPPGEEGIPVVGDGMLHEPGRYLLLCSIPTGADPDEYMAAAQDSVGPPQVAGGAPHFVHGMYAEIEVLP